MLENASSLARRTVQWIKSLLDMSEACQPDLEQQEAYDLGGLLGAYQLPGTESDTGFKTHSFQGNPGKLNKLDPV